MDHITYALKTIDDVTVIIRAESDAKTWCVPQAPGNRHYEEYLEWVAEGNEPEVIDG